MCVSAAPLAKTHLLLYAACAAGGEAMEQWGSLSASLTEKLSFKIK